MANETMRIFFPLKIITNPQGEYRMDDNPMEITPEEGCGDFASVTELMEIFM